MAQLTYTPDVDLKVHEEGAIKLICKAFQSHESGLPEWLKNSADAYARENAPEDKRVIIVILDHSHRGVRPSISCLDFSGMTSTIIESNFRVWADPEASQRGAKSASVQGGHGNGGKCYMTQMFQDYASIHTAKQGQGNRYGVVGGSIRFGYIPNRERGRNFEAEDLGVEIEKVLKPVRCSLEMLPKAALKAFLQADGFTFFTGVGPRGYEKRIPVQQLVTALQEHPQMIQTIDLCKIYIVVNGEIFNEGKPLQLARIAPMQGEEQREILIPPLLKDPATEEKISTTANDSLPAGKLILKTSEVSMRYKKRGRHNVIYKGESGYIGYIPVSELDVQSSYRDHIYGECSLDALEAFKQNERARLANSPLTRALERFISIQIQKYAKEFEARDRHHYDQEEKSAISLMNEAIDRWKNRFLNELMQGLWGGPGVGPPPPAPPLPAGKPIKAQLTLTHHRAGLNVAFRPTLKFFDKSGRRVRPVPFRWVSEDNNVAMVDEDLGIINTFTVGRTHISAETIKGKLESNKVPLEVVHIREIRIAPEQVQVNLGGREKLDGICRLAGGEETSDVYLVWTESDSSVARVSSAGLVFGFALGKTEVIAGDDKCQAKDPCVVEVIPGEDKGPGGQRGRGYPLVLVSGINRDPETNEERVFSKDEPPVAQRPQDVDRNIWWINSSAPLAKLYLDTNRGYGYQSMAWRMYHVERLIDVIVQIALTHGPDDKESLSASDWIVKWGYRVAEIQTAAAADLREFIGTGALLAE